MLCQTLIFVLANIVSSSAEDRGMDKLQSSKVIPDVIDDLPEHILQLKFGSLEVTSPGKTLTPTQVKTQPTELVYPTEAGDFYTITMTDPDAPSRSKPTQREWQHWLIANVPGTDVKIGEQLTEYVGAGPPKRTGLHRYVLLVYKQPGRMDFTGVKRISNRKGAGRGKRPVRTVLKELRLNSAPLVAATYFEAAWDDHVPELYKQLSEAASAKRKRK